MTWVSNKFKQFITNKKFKRQKLRPSWACDDSFSWSTRKLWNSKEIFLSQNICWKNWQVYLMVTKMWYGKYHITLYFLKHHLLFKIMSNSRVTIKWSVIFWMFQETMLLKLNIDERLSKLSFTGKSNFQKTMVMSKFAFKIVFSLKTLQHWTIWL